MSSTVLFVAGAFITFITVWGVVMAGGLYATRHQLADDERSGVGHEDKGQVSSAIGAGQLTVDPTIRSHLPAA